MRRDAIVQEKYSGMAGVIRATCEEIEASALINAVTRHVGTATNMSGNLTNQDSAANHELHALS